MRTQETMMRFSAELLRLRSLAGTPTLKDLVALTAGLDHPLARSTISDKLNAKSLPDWEFVFSFVTACKLYADKRGVTLPADLSDLEGWDARHWRMLAELDDARAGQRLVTAARTQIGQRVMSDAWPGETAANPALPIMVVCDPADAGKSTPTIHWARIVGDRVVDGRLYLEPGRPLPPQEGLAALLEILGVRRNDIPEDTAVRARRLGSLLDGRLVLVWRL